MDLIDTGTDPWILEYDACEMVAIEIMENLNARNSENPSSHEYNAISGKIRIRLKQFSSEVNELRKKLSLASVTSALTPEEKERRQRQVEALLSKEVQLNEALSQRKENTQDFSTLKSAREELFEKKGKKPVFADMGTASWGDIGRTASEEAEIDTRPLNEMREEQERLLKEQDEGLETLLKIVTKQTQIANTISNEVDHHNDILVEIADGMERVDNKMNRATDMVKVIGKKESIWRYWLVAFLLFIAILGVTFA